MLSIQIFFAVLAVGSIANAADVTPTEKVITMLEDLMTQTLVEGKAEAKTYDKFACFCKDATEEKTVSIKEGEDRVASLEADIADRIAFRTRQHDLQAEAQKALQANEDKEKAAQAKRAEQYKGFSEEKEDINVLKKEIKFAMEAIMSGVEGDELSQETVLKSVGAKMPALLEIKEKLAARVKTLRQDPDAGLSPQEKIVKAALEPLQADADAAWKKIHKREENEKNDLYIVLEEVHHVMTQQEAKIKKAQAKAETASDNIGRMSAELTLTSGTVTDDKAYLTELTSSCNAKSKAWDQRSKMRAEELTALTTALNILKGTVSDKQTGKTVRLLSIEEATKSATAPVDGEAKSTSFMQLRSARTVAKTFLHHVDEKEDPMARLADKMSEEIKKADVKRDALRAKVPLPQHVDYQKHKVVDLLKTRAATLHSQQLVALATEISGSPFDKITKLIQELIERLLQEAADEANHQGWCTKELTEAKEQRGRKVDAVSTLNGKLASNEALRDQLNEDLANLASQIAELEDALAKATSAKTDETEENAATIKEAEEGVAAISEAMDVLDKFYKTAAKASLIEEVSPSLLQAEGMQPDLPDAGFSNDAYTAQQGGAHGILGMMEVIKSDFERTVKVTAKAEKDAAKEFLEYETETKKSLAIKKNAQSAKDAELRETIDTINEQMDNLKEEQVLLDKAVQELLELEPACFPKQMSYEERVAKREQEISALKEALCTLDKEGPVQTEAGDCGTLEY
jgi:hypothetical protein